MAKNTFRSLGILALKSYGANFVSKFILGGGMPSPYGISNAQETALDTANTDYAAAADDLEAKELAYRTAVTTKNTTRQALLDNIASCADTAYGNPVVTDTMLTDAGLAIHDTGDSAIMPVVPSGLEVFGCQTGNSLKWSRNGNKQGVVFAIERRVPAGTFAQIGMTKKREYFDSSAIRGAEYEYRVFAYNNGVQSDPTMPIPVFNNPAEGGGEELEVAA